MRGKEVLFFESKPSRRDDTKLELYLLNERVTLIDAHSREVDMNTNEIRSMLREILSVISSD